MESKGVVTAIDFGQTKIVALSARVGWTGEPSIIGIGISKSKGISKGGIVNADEAALALADCIYQTESSSKTKVEDAFVTISGANISSKNTYVNISTEGADRKVSREDVLRALAQASQVSGLEGHKVLQVVPRGYTLDGGKTVKDPVGMPSSHLALSAHLILGSAKGAKGIREILEAVEISPLGLVAAPIASGEAVLSTADKEIGVVLADIGHDGTSGAVYRDGAPVHTFYLPVGGHHFTNDIAFTLGLSLEDAERIKVNLGNAFPKSIPPDERIDLEMLGLSEKRKLYRKQVCDILKERAVELLRMIGYRIREAQLVNKAPAGLVLTGGASCLPGLEQLGPEVLHLPTRLGEPDGMFGLPALIRTPAYATPLGALRWGLKHTEKPARDGKVFSLNGHRPSLREIYDKVSDKLSDWARR